jgi:hypothetical protein
MLLVEPAAKLRSIRTAWTLITILEAASYCERNNEQARNQDSYANMYRTTINAVRNSIHAITSSGSTHRRR